MTQAKPVAVGPQPIVLPVDDCGELIFDWIGDRFTHRLSVNGAACFQSADVPTGIVQETSPPVQQLHCQKIDGVETALGVGAGGGFHFSLVAKCLGAVPGPPGVEFQWACRRRVRTVWPSDFPRSLYHVPATTPRIDCEIELIEALQLDGPGDVTILRSRRSESSLTAQWCYRLNVPPPPPANPMTEPLRRRELLGGAVAVPLMLAGATAESPIKPATMPPIALNTATIRGQKLSVLQQIDIATAAGYDAIEPWIGDLRQQIASGSSAAELRGRLRDAGLTMVSAIGFARWIVDDPVARQAGLDEAKSDMELVASLGARLIAAPPVGVHKAEELPPAGPPPLDVIAERFAALNRLGQSVGVTPLLELWGFSPVLSTLAELAYVATAATGPRVGLLGATGLLPHPPRRFADGAAPAGRSVADAVVSHQRLPGDPRGGRFERCRSRFPR